MHLPAALAKRIVEAGRRLVQASLHNWNKRAESGFSHGEQTDSPFGRRTGTRLVTLGSHGIAVSLGAITPVDYSSVKLQNVLRNSTDGFKSLTRWF